MKNLLEKLKARLMAQWIVCRTISDKKSVQYGIRFSYPAYIMMVVTGILLQNAYILAVTAVIAFFGTKLPMHPFDYVYNFVVAKLGSSTKIPGRGSELQVNSTIALIFNLVVIALIGFSIPISFVALIIIYLLASIFFVGRFLL
jgi:hypothetical protein